MNLPIGEMLSRGVNFKEVDGKKLVEGFFDKKFSGYLVVTLEGIDGIEEGIILFKEGRIVGAFYDYDLEGITVFGDTSIPHVFNSFAAEHVVADIVSLSNQQVDLVTAFNDKSKLEKPINRGQIRKLIPKVFSNQPAQSVLSEISSEKDSRKDIFKKLGLTGLGD